MLHPLSNQTRGGKTVNRPLCNIRRVLLPLAIVAATLLYAGAATASAPTNTGIEGVWSFNGGQIGVQRLSNGAYAGTVVAETKFAECAHPVGQQIWTGMTEQHDGSYWGLHQWYEANCQENPVRGPTAWRILEERDGAHYMRVCFSHPGSSQPTIAADGAPKGESEYAAHGVTYGCYNSARIAPLPGAPGAPGSTGTPGTSGTPGTEGGASGSVENLSLPSAHRCLSPRLKRFTIRLKDPQYDPFKTVTITFKGHRVKAVRHGGYMVATIDLSHLHAHSFTIKVKATTVLGHMLSAHRTYHLCAKKHKPGKHGKKG
jgi:hypothetical protein